MGQFLGSVVGAGAGAIMANQQQQANIGLQNAAENWEEHMSDTAFQRQKADMTAAGLNPMLMVGQGGASTPNAPIIPAVDKSSDVMAGAQLGANTAKSVEMLDSQLKNVQADTSLKGAQNDKAGYDAMGSFMDNKLKTQTIDDEARITKARADLAEAMGVTATNKENVERMMPHLFGAADAILGRSGAALGTAQKAAALIPGE